MTRIMVDANVIISAFLYPISIPGKVLKHIIVNHTLILSDYTLSEINRTFFRKFPELLLDLQNYLDSLTPVTVSLKYIDENKYPQISDPKDLPVLANAIESGVEILVTGDNDFNEIKINKPRILKPRQYYDEFIN